MNSKLGYKRKKKEKIIRVKGTVENALMRTKCEKEKHANSIKERIFML